MHRNRISSIDGALWAMWVLTWGFLRSRTSPTAIVHAFPATSSLRCSSSRCARGARGLHYLISEREAVITNRFYLNLSTLSSSEIDELNVQIQQKGDEIRRLKENGIEKNELAPHISELKRLKSLLPSEEPAANSKAVPNTAAVAETKSKSPSPQNTVKKFEEMSESEYRINRINKIEEMRRMGVEPYEYTYRITHTAVQLNQEYEGDRLQNGQEDEEADVAVAGRIMTRRVFGKLAFFNLQDATGLIQLQFDKSRLNDSFQVCPLSVGNIFDAKAKHCFLVAFILL
jgi:OB-fold nucleic acid binding domain